jgi:RNA polymerase sigma-70 factor (ECF subfamily)
MEDKDQLIALTKSIQSGNLAAFDKFYDATKKAVFFTGLSIIRDQSSVADLMQDTYFDFLTNIQNVRLDPSIKAYLCTIMHNKAINLKLKQNKEVLLDAYGNDDLYGSFTDETADEQLFRTARSLLKDEEYQIVIMHAISELTFAEIAKSIGKPLGTILWEYSIAIKKLQKGLGDKE